LSETQGKPSPADSYPQKYFCYNLYMIKAVVFDVGGVLHETSGDFIFKDIMQTLEITEDVLKEAWFENINKLGRGEITEKEFWRLIVKKTKSKKPLPRESLLLREFINHYNRNDAAINLVNRLKTKGYKVAILSNTVKSHAYYQYEIGVYQNFDTVVLSHEIGMLKPDLEIYEYLLKKLQVKPEEVIFTDDKINNIEAAAKLGIHAILFKNIEQLKTELEKLGVKV
jgi:putative hydrolase of the HAD superfamily